MGLLDKNVSIEASKDRNAAVVENMESGTQSPPIGKHYEGGRWLVERAEYLAYAAATDDSNVAYTGKDAVAPPMYHVRPFIHVLSMMASDPELALDMLRLVHAEHDMTFHRVLKDGDVIRLSGTLEAVHEKSSGKLVKYRLAGVVDGETALEGRTSYFIRAKQPAARKKKSAKGEVSTPPEPHWTTSQCVHDDQALRYAEASGDRNPIHIDEETAKSAGLPGCILHGLCTMAFAQRDLIRAYCADDPARLQRISVRWAKPVFPGERLTLKVWEQEEGRVSFVTENEAGQVVMSNGLAEIRSA